jgi:hypothetical protein
MKLTIKTLKQTLFTVESEPSDTVRFIGAFILTVYCIFDLSASLFDLSFILSCDLLASADLVASSELNRVSVSHTLDLHQHHFAHRPQIQVLKQNIEASKGAEYYADGLKLIFSGMLWSSRKSDLGLLARLFLFGTMLLGIARWIDLQLVICTVFE